jgi:hypothetical protein
MVLQLMEYRRLTRDRSKGDTIKLQQSGSTLLQGRIGGWHWRDVQG